MLAELTQLESGWLLAAPLAIAVAAQGLLAGRRRALLNEALHELRRPLQGLVLTAEGSALGRGKTREAGLPQQAALALERLDREINGGAERLQRTPVGVAELLEAAVVRWRGQAAQSGADLALREPCLAVGPVVSGDQDGLSRALDNLIVNAIEHGGPTIRAAAELGPATVRVAVADSGGAGLRKRSERGIRSVGTALSGRRRHGHGLRVVRRVAAEHGGEFRLRRSQGGTEAVLELPLASGAGAVR